MDKNSETIKKFISEIAPIANQLGLEGIDLDAIAREVVLNSEHAFLRARPPVIAVTGITHTGKSTLINTMFGQKRLKEGLTADTSDRIVKIRFASGLMIYDTPGAGGLNSVYENRTRAFLGLKQLGTDINGKPLEPIEKIETIDALTYDPLTNSPVQLLRHEDFAKPDLFIFIVDIKAGTLRRDDVQFFREVAELGPSVMVVVNKIDELDESAINQSLIFVRETLSRDAIPVSAKNNTNVDKLVSQMILRLPKNCIDVVSETIDKDYKNLVRKQLIKAHSLATAIKIAQSLAEGQVSKLSSEFVPSILGLYLWTLNQYQFSQEKLKESGANFFDMASSVEGKIKSGKNLKTEVGLLTLAGTVVGAGIALATGGIAIPVLISVGVGSATGLSMAGLISVLRGLYKHSKLIDMNREANELNKVIKTSNPSETAASIYAFGEALSVCCSVLESNPHGKRPNFYEIFDEEYRKIRTVFRPFNDKFKGNDDTQSELLLNSLFEKVTT